MASNNVEFDKRHVLSLHSSPITSIAFSECGNWLASGAEDGYVGIWNVFDGTLEQQLDLRIGGAVSYLCWTSTLGRDGGHCLIVATSDTRVRLWSMDHRRDRFLLRPKWALTAFQASGSQIESMAISEGGGRHLLAVVGGGNLILYSMEGTDSIQQILAESFQATARAVHFTDGGAILIIGLLESRELFVWQVDPWKKRMHVELNSRIAHTAWSPEYRTLAVANLVNGVDLYQQLEPPIWNKTLTRASLINNVKQVAFSHKGRLVVSGGDTGRAHVWSRADGELIQVLEHDSDSSIQVIAAASTTLGHTIATGESAGQYRISVWAEGRREIQGEHQLHLRPHYPEAQRFRSLVSVNIVTNGLIVVFLFVVLHLLDTSGYLTCFSDRLLKLLN